MSVAMVYYTLLFLAWFGMLRWFEKRNVRLHAKQMADLKAVLEGFERQLDRLHASKTPEIRYGKPNDEIAQ